MLELFFLFYYTNTFQLLRNNKRRLDMLMHLNTFQRNLCSKKLDEREKVKQPLDAIRETK